MQMADTSPSKKSAYCRVLRLLILAASCLFLVAAALYLLLRMILSSNCATEKISDLLSEKAGCRVTVSGANISGDTLTLEGISLRNPDGFSRNELLSIRSISLSPDWIRLLAGKASLDSLELAGTLIRLESNPSGKWNGSELISRIMKKKREPTGEILIAHLAIRDLSLIVNGRRSASLGLITRNFSTRGSTESQLTVSAEDPAGNPIHLTARGKMGPIPSFRIDLVAPHLSLASMQLLGKRNLPVAFDNATAGIRFAAELHSSLTTARFRGTADKIGLRAGTGIIPLKGSLDVSIRYDKSKDEACIDAGTIAFNNSPPFRFSGSINQVRRDALFEFRVSRNSLPLESFLSLFPESLRKATKLGGMLSTNGLTIRGNRRTGIASGQMDLSIRNGSVAENGRILLEKGTMDMIMKGGSDGWLLHGRFFSAPGTAAPIIRSVEAPFTARFSPRMKPLQLVLPAITARVAGTDLKGKLNYFYGTPAPWSGAFSATVADFASLNKYLSKTSLKFETGSGILTTKASGSSLQLYEGHVTATADSLLFSSLGRKISLKKAVVTSRMRSDRNGFFANGDLKIDDGILLGGTWDISAGYSVGKGRLELRNADLRGDRTRIRLSAATMALKFKPTGKGDASIPIVGTLKGLDVLQSPVSATGISGSVNCRYYSAASDRQLRGSADLDIPSLAVKDRKAASLSARLSFSGKDATAKLRGTSLGGPVEGTIQAKPFAGDRSLSFLVRFREQQLSELSELLPPRQGVRLSGGLLNTDLEGTMVGKSGLKAKLTATGRDISMRNAGGREIIAGLGLKLLSVVNGADFSLQEAVISRGTDITARLSGSVKRFASAERKGNVSCTVDTVRLNSILDAFANVLPRALQEAEGQGTLAMRGDISLDGKRFGTDGEITIAGASLEIPSQKVTVAGIDGRLPFSFVFPGQKHERQASPVSYSKDNYQRLLTADGSVKTKGSLFRIGFIHFGALQTGKIEAYVNAGRGMVEINSLNVSLYEGTLMGKGFLGYDDGLEIEANLLLNNLSLKQFCAAFQKIEGYMTGRVDGVTSLYQGNNKVRGLNGFVNLWTRTGNGEKMLVSKEFLQKLSGKKLRGFLFTNDRSYDNGEISAFLRDGFLTFEKLDISHTNMLGMKDLSVTVVPVQNRISLGHLMESIREAAARGKSAGSDETNAPVQTDLKWLE